MLRFTPNGFITFVLALPAIAQVDVLTHHNDNARTGANLNETTLTVANVNSRTFGKLARRVVDGNIYAQPLIVSQAKAINRSGPASLAIVATEHNSVYAFDADDTDQNSTTAKIWQTGPDVLGTPIESAPFYAELGMPQCADLTTEIGITGTPAIQILKAATATNSAEGIVFVAAKSKLGAAYKYNLFALNLSDGSKIGSIAIEGQVRGRGMGSTGAGANSKLTFDPRLHLNRPGLLLVGNTLYVAFGGHCYKGSYHGWLFAYDVSNPQALKQIGVLCITPNGKAPLVNGVMLDGLGGIWMSGEGPSVDDMGNIYFSTANGTYNGTTDFGDSVVKTRLESGGIKVLDWFTPSNETLLKNADLDLGSSGAIVIPNTHLLIAAGKEGRMYLLDRNNLGKETLPAVQSFQVTHEFHLPFAYNIRGSAVWARTGEIFVYMNGEEDPIRQFRLIPDPASSAGWKFDPPGPFKSSTVSAPYPNFPDGQFGRADREPVWMPGGFMSISASGTTGNSGILWVAMPLNGNANKAVVRGVLRAFDASDVSKPQLWDSESTGDGNDRLGHFAKFNPPTIANGKVYVATFQEEIVTAHGRHLKDPQGDPPALVIYGLRQR